MWSYVTLDSEVKSMTLPTEKIPVIKDGKCYQCTLQAVPVRGGKLLVYTTDDGTIIKQEPMHRYTQRIKQQEK